MSTKCKIAQLFFLTLLSLYYVHGIIGLIIAGIIPSGHQSLTNYFLFLLFMYFFLGKIHSFSYSSPFTVELMPAIEKSNAFFILIATGERLSQCLEMTSEKFSKKLSISTLTVN